MTVIIKAYRIKASERMKLFAFKNGIPHSYLVHVAKTNAKSFEEVVLECENFEKIQELEVYLNKQEETRVHEQTKGANRVNTDTRRQKYIKSRRTRNRTRQDLRINSNTVLDSAQPRSQGSDMIYSKPKTHERFSTHLLRGRGTKDVQEEHTENSDKPMTNRGTQ